MKVLIHVGHRKAASTWLQDTVFESVRTQWHLARHDWILKSFLEQIKLAPRQAFPRESFSAYLSHLEWDGVQRILVSDEALVGDAWQDSSPGDEIARGLLEAFAGCDVHILFVMREQASLLRSMYNQYVAHGGCKAFSSFSAGKAPFTASPGCWLDYSDLLDRYASRLPGENIHLLLFEDLVSEFERFQERLERALGSVLDGVEKERDVRKNQGLSRPSLHSMRLLNRLFRQTVLNPRPLWPGSPQGKWVRSAVERGLEGTLFRWAPRRPSKGERAVAARVAIEYRTGNRAVAADWGLPLASRGYYV